MPFVARCHRCGYIESAFSRWLLNICMEGHDTESHGDHPTDQWSGKPLTWIVAVVSEADYYMIQRLSKTPTFWEAQRLPKKLQVQVAK